MESKVTPNLMVEDVPATARYYVDVLGFEPVMCVGMDKQVRAGLEGSKEQLVWAMVKKGGVEIFFQRRDSISGEYPDLEGRPLGGSLTLYITTDSVNEVYGALKHKAEMVKELETTFYGATEFAVRDPNGFIICFGQMPA